MRQLAEFLSDHGVASLRYDKVGTGATGLGPYADRPAEVGSAVYTAGARSAVRFLAGQPDTDPDRVSVYAVGRAQYMPCRWLTTPLPARRASTRWDSCSRSPRATSI